MTSSFYADLGHRIRVARVDAGLRQADLAKQAGLDRSYLSRIERGEARCGAEVLAEVADALDVSMDELAGRG